MRSTLLRPIELRRQNAPANDNGPKPRPVASATISFGLISCEVWIHAAGKRPRRPRVARTDSLELTTFVPRDALSLTMIGSTRWLAPGPGSERSHALLANVLARRQVVAVGVHSSGRGRRVDVAIVAEQGALVLVELVSPPPPPERREAPIFKDVEIELAKKLVERSSADVVELAAQVDDEDLDHDDGPRAQVIDLFEALKRSLKR